MHICINKEIYLQESRGFITLLDKTIQKPRKLAIREMNMSGVS